MPRSNANIANTNALKLIPKAELASFAILSTSIASPARRQLATRASALLASVCQGTTVGMLGSGTDGPDSGADIIRAIVGCHVTEQASDAPASVSVCNNVHFYAVVDVFAAGRVPARTLECVHLVYGGMDDTTPGWRIGKIQSPVA